MRALKFRAFANGKMRYDVTGFEHGDKNEMLIIFLNGDDYRIGLECEVMQFTGLTDKNGTEIYEGDLVKYNGTERDIDYEGRESKVENRGGYLIPFFEEVGNSSGFMYETRIDFGSIEVVGSIYEDLKA